MKQSSRIFSGALFDAINKCSFACEDVIPYFMAAIVKCAATRGTSRSGVSIHITESDAKSVASKRLPMAKEANALMNKTAILTATIGDCALVEDRGDMECNMVDFVLEKMSKEDRAKTNLTAIAEKFLKTMCFPKQEPAVDNADDDENAIPIFDPSQNVAVQTVANLGWTVGLLVGKKKASDFKRPSKDEQFEISYINDEGGLGLCPVGKGGVPIVDSIIVVNKTDIGKQYKVLDNSQRLSIEKNYPRRETSTAGIEHAIGIMALHSAFQSSNIVPKESIYIQSTPSTKLIVSAASLEIGDIMLMPWATSMKPVKKDKAPEFVLTGLRSTDDVRHFELDKPCPKAYGVYEFWKLRKVGEKEHANMEFAMVTVKVPLPKLKGFANTMVVELPQAVLFKNVKEGDELVLYIPALKKEATPNKRSIPVATSRVVKAKPCEKSRG